MAEWRVLEGDCRVLLQSLEPGSVRCCVTSPPYFGLRDYGHDGQIGFEPTPDEFVAALGTVFREVRRVLRDDGTVWLNLGDSFCTNPWAGLDGRAVKTKDLLGIPWMVAFALRADGWYLRSDVIWSKPNPMPESVTDRPTKAHEYLFLLSKSPRYFYDVDAIREPVAPATIARDAYGYSDASGYHDGNADPKGGGLRGLGGLGSGRTLRAEDANGRNRRSVWTVATQSFPGAHFATFPPKLIEPCILAGSREGDVVLDPFSGSGTTGMVALRHGRSYIGCELNPEYVRLSRDRIIADAPLLNTHAEAA